MTFLHEKEIYLNISPPDTTAVTQLLDQINHSIHDRYRQKKDEIFEPHHTINREGFMEILSEMWPTWCSTASITAAAKRVGISSTGLNVGWMQKEKFQRAQSLLHSGEEQPACSSTPDPLKVRSPESIRSGSRDYYKYKYEEAMKKLHEISDESINLEVAGVLNVKKIVPKESKKKTRITQVSGSMAAQDIIATLKGIDKSKKDKEEKKKATGEKRQNDKEAYYRCLKSCQCDTKTCAALQLKQCESCHNILKSICSKSTCRGEDGSKPNMIPLMWLSKRKHSVKQKFAKVSDISDTSDSSEYEVSDYEDEFTDDGEDDISHDEDDAGDTDDDINMAISESLKCGDYVKVVSGLFKGFYATVLGKSYGGEVEIQYFQEKYGKWVLKENDIDSRLPEELIKVTAEMDRRSYFIFSH